MVIPDTFKSAPVGWRKGRPYEDVLFAPIFPIKGGSTPTDLVVPVIHTTDTNGAQSSAPSPAAFQHGATGERTFSAEDIAKARKEEKDKLYTELTSLKEQFSSAQKTLQEIQDQKAQELAAVEQKQAEFLALHPEFALEVSGQSTSTGAATKKSSATAAATSRCITALQASTRRAVRGSW